MCPEKGEQREVSPVLLELIRLLPEPHAEWSYVDRQAWLAAMEAVFKVVYEEPTPKGRSN